MDNKNFWGAKSGPLTHAWAVNCYRDRWLGQTPLTNFQVTRKFFGHFFIIRIYWYTEYSNDLEICQSEVHSSQENTYNSIACLDR